MVINSKFVSDFILSTIWNRFWIDFFILKIFLHKGYFDFFFVIKIEKLINDLRFEDLKKFSKLLLNMHRSAQNFFLSINIILLEDLQYLKSFWVTIWLFVMHNLPFRNSLLKYINCPIFIFIKGIWSMSQSRLISISNVEFAFCM